MARARNIKPGFYKNEDLAECSVWARLIFPGLWMLADRDGRLEDRPKRIKAELLPFDDGDMDKLLQELHDRGFLVRYQNSDGRFIQVSKFAEHQSPHYSEKPSAIMPPELPEFSGKLGDVGGQDIPGSLPELSGSDGPIKRGSQPPDSLNPYSLNHESLHPPSRRKRERNPETPLPSPDWEPSADAMEWTQAKMAEHALTDSWAWEQLDAMRDYATQHPAWKHADWNATWRNWVRKALERLPRRAA